MSPILKITLSFCLALAAALMPGNIYAQCKLNIKTTAHITKVETQDNYQYIRSVTDYLGISTHTVLLKKPTGNSYNLVIKYTGSTSVSHLLHLTFRFKDSVVMALNLRLVKTQKTDNPKLNTKIYEAGLTAPNLAYLQQKQLLDFTVSFLDKKDLISIPVNDAAFMQTQIACLQQQIK